MAPTSVPIDAEVATTVRPTRNEMRAPARTRARMSRPSSSRPNGCVELGPASRSARSCADGSNGVTSGPTSAASAASTTMAAPVLSTSLEPDARIEQAVNEVGEQVHRHVGDRDQQDASLDQRIVAEADRLNQETA